MRFELFLQRLETAQAEMAREALGQPQARDSFEYGRVSGIYAGLEIAKTLLIDTVVEQERK